MKRGWDLFKQIVVFLMCMSILFSAMPLGVQAEMLNDSREERLETNNFVPRTTAPSKDNGYYYANNPFYQAGYGMPNCTAYAYGRAWEILGTKPALSRGNAGQWWTYNKTTGAYTYGSTPKLGAIACWDKYDNNQGHVAVVEAINGSNVTISESHYNGTNFDTSILFDN